MSGNSPRWLPVVALLLAAAPAAGAEQADLQIHGFASQGWVLSAGNNVNGSSDDNGGSGEFRELGINASWRPLAPLMFAAQMAAVEHGKATDEDMVLDYGLVDWTPLTGKSGRAGLRAGKLKVPIGFYNDSRDVVFTRPGITLPESVYLENSGARSFGYFSAEGGGAYGDWYAGDHALYGEFVFARKQTLLEEAEIAILRTPTSGEFDVDQAVVARLSDDYDGGRWRAALSVLISDLSYHAAAAPPPGEPFNQSGGFDFDQAVLSLQYNSERWSVTSEIVARHLELDDLSGAPFPLSPLINDVKQDPWGWYLQGSYRVQPKWSVLLRYDEQIRDGQDRHGYEQAANSAALSAAAAGTVPALPRHYFFAKDWTVGTRYDLRPNVAVWAEYHYVNGAGWVNPLDNTGYSVTSAVPGGGSANADRYWNMFMVMLGFRL